MPSNSMRVLAVGLIVFRAPPRLVEPRPTSSYHSFCPIGQLIYPSSRALPLQNPVENCLCSHRRLAGRGVERRLLDAGPGVHGRDAVRDPGGNRTAEKVVADAEAAGAGSDQRGPGRVAGKPLLLCRAGHGAGADGHLCLPVLLQPVSFASSSGVTSYALRTSGEKKQLTVVVPGNTRLRRPSLPHSVTTPVGERTHAQAPESIIRRNPGTLKTAPQSSLWGGQMGPTANLIIPVSFGFS